MQRTKGATGSYALIDLAVYFVQRKEKKEKTKSLIKDRTQLGERQKNIYISGSSVEAKRWRGGGGHGNNRAKGREKLI